MNILNRSFAWLGKQTRDLLRNASYSVENLTVTHSVLSNHLMTRERKHGYALQLSEMSTIVILSNSGKKGMEKGKAMQEYILLSKTLEKKYGLMI